MQVGRPGRGLGGLGLPAPPTLVLLLRVVGLLDGHGVSHQDEGHLAILGLVGPLLDGPELADVVGLAQRLLERRARFGVLGLDDDVLLRRDADDALRRVRRICRACTNPSPTG